jgi:hypothetical protein
MKMWLLILLSYFQERIQNNILSLRITCAFDIKMQLMKILLTITIQRIFIKESPAKNLRKSFFKIIFQILLYCVDFSPKSVLSFNLNLPLCQNQR